MKGLMLVLPQHPHVLAQRRFAVPRYLPPWKILRSSLHAFCDTVLQINPPISLQTMNWKEQVLSSLLYSSNQHLLVVVYRDSYLIYAVFMSEWENDKDSQNFMRISTNVNRMILVVCLVPTKHLRFSEIHF